MKISAFTILFLFAVSTIFAQPEYSFGDQCRFTNHLLLIQNFDEAVWLLHTIEKNRQVSANQYDTLYYLQGLAHYKLHHFDTSLWRMNAIQTKSAFFVPSRFIVSYDYVMLQKYDTAQSVLFSQSFSRNEDKKNKYDMLCGISLLKRDIAEFELYEKKYEQIGDEKTVWQEEYEKMKDFKPKSMVFAGVLSAMVPGLGKIYAGKTGEGIAAFFTVGTTGLLACENYRKSGWRNYKTIIFSSLFTIFYGGNILGSYYSVKRRRDEFYYKIDKDIREKIKKAIEKNAVYKKW